MPYEPVGNEGPSTSWGSHSYKHQKILEFHELEGLPIVPSTMIKILPNEFNWGLCTISLLFGHVQIINKHNAFFTDRWPIVTLSPFLHLAVYRVLGLIGACLS
jgi:hypothetical protein